MTDLETDPPLVPYSEISAGCSQRLRKLRHYVASGTLRFTRLPDDGRQTARLCPSEVHIAKLLLLADDTFGMGIRGGTADLRGFAAFLRTNRIPDTQPERMISAWVMKNLGHPPAWLEPVQP